MKTLVLSIVLLFAVASCATTVEKQPILYNSYSEFVEATNKSNIDKLASYYFNPAALGEGYETDPDTLGQLLFYNVMINRQTIYESISGETGCLSINGFGEENRPLIFNIDYSSNNERWLIDKVRVVFADSTAEFVTQTNC